jgi:hypothetical protein
MKEGCIRYLLLFLLVLLFSLVFAFVFAYFGVLLWNYAVVSIFGLPKITYWQMFALMVLVRMFFPSGISYKSE